MKCPNWGKILAAAALCAALCACSKPQDILPDHTATPETSATVAPTAAVVQATATPAPTDTTVPTILPQTADAGRSYVDDTLFIGDSNTVRYTMYADDTGTAFSTLKNNIGVVSMGAGSITTLKCEKFKGDSTLYTIPDAVAKLQPKRIIIGFGSNNLGGSSTDATKFIAQYREGLAAITKAWPYADIIVSAIPPLDQQRDNTNLTMTQVDAYNAALVTMCEEDGYKFLNTAEVLRDDATGWAKKDYTLSDGVHLSKEAVTAYFTYVRTHAYVTQDRRPESTAAIPEPDGVPPGLISSDPIAVRGAKVPVEFVATSGGSISGSTSQKVKKGGTCSTVKAVPDAGWKFAGWTASLGAASSSSSLSFTVPSNADANGVIVTAHFEPDEHEHEFVEVKDTRIEPTCLEYGTVKVKCTICGEVKEKELPALGHDYDKGVITLQPQPGIAGVMTYTCQRCAKLRYEYIPKTEPVDKWKNPYRDVRSTAWYYEDVAYVTRNDLMVGTGTMTFSPDGEMSRAMLVTVLYRMNGSPSVAGMTMPFQDVPGNAWYTDAVTWAYNCGVVSGMSPTTFAPMVSITREQMMTMFYGYAAYMDYNTMAVADLSAFPDGGDVSSWAEAEMGWAVANTLISGAKESDGVYLRPQGTATRAEAAAILHRFDQWRVNAVVTGK